MGRPTLIVLLVCGAVGGWYALSRQPSLEGVFTGPARAWHPVPGLSPSPGRDGSGQRSAPPFPALLPRDARFVRVASFHLDLLDRGKLENDTAFERTATILSQFDLIAIQGLAAAHQHVIPSLVDRLKLSGLPYDCAVGPRIGRGEEKQCLAFVFDARRIELDRAELFTVDDPDDLMCWEPLVGWFRVRGPGTADAFTFTLVNVQVDSHHAPREHRVLGELFHAVRNDSRREDDVLLLGSLQADAVVVQERAKLADTAWAVSGLATSTDGTRALDNLAYSRAFTDEATGRSGVFDFLRQLNLSLEQATAVSTHLPVWAEFHVVEGGRAGAP